MENSRSACIAALVVMLGCGGSGSVSEEAHEEEGHSSSEDHADTEGVVHIESAMLRDLRVTVRPAESRTAGETVTVLGELGVNEDAYAEVGTTIPARVARVLAAPGDRVEPGRPLVELESPDVGRARAEIADSRARAELAQQTADRRHDLATERIASQRDVETAEAELASANAASRAARDVLVSLGASRGSGGRFILSSPIAGTVIDRTALLGRLVDSGEPLFVVGDLSRLWLTVHVFERDALRIRTNGTARVDFPALPNRTFTGRVTHIASRVDPASRTLAVRIEIDNAGGELRPGMSASALVPIGDSTDTVVAVPIEAVQRLAEGWCVFLPRGTAGEFEIRTVGRGRDLGVDVEILSGLRAGEPVVVDGAFLLKAEAEKSRGGGADHHH